MIKAEMTDLASIAVLFLFPLGRFGPPTRTICAPCSRLFRSRRGTRHLTW
jgi:hypothetical protein